VQRTLGSRSVKPIRMLCGNVKIVTH